MDDYGGYNGLKWMTRGEDALSFSILIAGPGLTVTPRVCATIALHYRQLRSFDVNAFKAQSVHRMKGMSFFVE